jgi:hypothetical protein
MNTNPQIGVFICKCGQKIEPLVDLPALQKNLAGESAVTCCDILPYPCLKPGMDHIVQQIREKDRKSTRLNSSHNSESRMPSSAGQRAHRRANSECRHDPRRVLRPGPPV